MTSNDGSRPQHATAMAEAWRQAASDLGFEFVTPFTFVDRLGHQHTCSGLVTHFGGPMGTLIVAHDDEDPDADIVGSELGYYTSALNPEHYEHYDRELFRETLIDWGWYGPPEKHPAWLAKT